MDVARGFLISAPQDRSGEDRTLVVVQVSAEQLARNVPAATPDSNEDVPAGSAAEGAGNVPAATPPTAAVCHIEGVGSVEAATAQRHACDSALLGAIIDKHGKVLALGRTRRLLSKAQRRALLIRDKMCRYPGCQQTRHLKAHHVVSWILGGRTDLDNLILLCQWHHTAVHEGGVTITGDCGAWAFGKPDGRPCDHWVDDANLARHLAFIQRPRQAERNHLAAVDSFQHPDAQPSDPAGPVNPSTSTPASKPSSPSNSPSQPRTLINKPRNWIGAHPLQPRHKYAWWRGGLVVSVTPGSDSLAGDSRVPGRTRWGSKRGDFAEGDASKVCTRSSKVLTALSLSKYVSMRPDAPPSPQAGSGSGTGRDVLGRTRSSLLALGCQSRPPRAMAFTGCPVART